MYCVCLAKIVQSCPWHFRMAAIIDEHTDASPVGLRSGTTCTHTTSRSTSPGCPSPLSSLEDDSEFEYSHGQLNTESVFDDIDVEFSAIQSVPPKQMLREISPDVSRKAGKLGKAAASGTNTSSNTKKQFVKISEGEITAQMRLKVKRECIEMETMMGIEKIRVQGEAKIEKEKMKATFTLKKLQLQQDQEYRMALLKQGQGPAVSMGMGIQSSLNYGFDIYQTPDAGGSNNTVSLEHHGHTVDTMPSNNYSLDFMDFGSFTQQICHN